MSTHCCLFHTIRFEVHGVCYTIEEWNSRTSYGFLFQMLTSKIFLFQNLRLNTLPIILVFLLAMVMIIVLFHLHQLKFAHLFSCLSNMFSSFISRAIFSLFAVCHSQSSQGYIINNYISQYHNTYILSIFLVISVLCNGNILGNSEKYQC